MADKRWKQVERGAAEELNRVLSGIGHRMICLANHAGAVKFTPVERIPLLGREGPDLTVNESGLVINVKSRQSIHNRLFPDAFQLLFCGDLVIFRLSELSCVNTFLMEPVAVDRSKMVQDWYDRMDKWTKEFQPDGISAIFLHRPRMPYGNMGVVIDFNNLRRLQCNLKLN